MALFVQNSDRNLPELESFEKEILAWKFKFFGKLASVESKDKIYFFVFEVKGWCHKLSGFISPFWMHSSADLDV